ncbi:MAG: 16S rRNA (cytidine(1402)-2'-O)-methyltransferase [Thermodesulfobacteriota bacterium]
MSKQPGRLYVVATPIGNLDDITIRASRILAEVDLIAAEDTRVSRKLLSALGISTPLVSHYKGQEARQSAGLLKRLQAGEDIALISDAGTPAISDPGARLVAACHEAGIKVIPIPGPSALTALASVAGVQAESGFIFSGFLPSQKGKRRKMLTSLRFEERTFIFYESPHRIKASLADLVEILGDRPLIVGRELTKLHEEIISAPASQALASLAKRPAIKGEFVVAVMGHAPGGAEEHDSGDIEELLTLLRDQGELSLKDATKKLSKDLGIPRKQVYKLALTLWDKKG